MDNLNEFFHQLADEGDAIRADSDILRMTRLKEKVLRRNESRRNAAIYRALVDRDRDQIIARLAELLGITRADFPAFFDHVNNMPDE